MSSQASPDSVLDMGIGDVTAIPCEEVIHVVDGGTSNVVGVIGCGLWYEAGFDQVCRDRIDKLINGKER